MAETAKAPAADATPATRPQKPDEDAYQKALAAAEKEHKDVMTRFVRSILFSLLFFWGELTRLQMAHVTWM